MQEKTFCNVTRSPIEWEKNYLKISSDECGAYSSFLGVVRNHNLGKQVKAVEYDVLLPLALNVFNGFCQSIRQEIKAPLNICIEHFQGLLGVSQSSVLIIVGSAHRKEAIQACDTLIEMLKESAPIWKKEYYVDGQTQWVKGHELCQHS
jgi:molybdopterin synthase catalytic subunit